jgi:hypothetical protein
MSDENKDLGDKAEDALDGAKKGAKKAADKAEENFDKAKDAAKEAGENAKEAAKDFAEEAKETANEFKEDVKKTFDPNSPDSGKTVAIIAHITFIGWIVAIIMNSQNKTEFGSYYIRQTLGIWIIMMLLGFVPIVGCFAGLLGLVLIIISLVNAANGKMTPTVGVGHLFQDWFKSL